MIDFRELRCGNIIRKRDNNFIVDQNNILTIARNPIPYLPLDISEEILLKCGFERKNELMFFLRIKHKMSVEIEFIIDDMGRFIIKQSNQTICINIELLYLHQLQNLYFALTNTDLETSKLL